MAYVTKIGTAKPASPISHLLHWNVLVGDVVVGLAIWAVPAVVLLIVAGCILAAL